VYMRLFDARVLYAGWLRRPVGLGRSERATRSYCHTMVASTVRFWNGCIFDFIFTLYSACKRLYTP